MPMGSALATVASRLALLAADLPSATWLAHGASFPRERVGRHYGDFPAKIKGRAAEDFFSRYGRCGRRGRRPPGHARARDARGIAPDVDTLTFVPEAGAARRCVTPTRS